jgi:hypothetical protein
MSTWTEADRERLLSAPDLVSTERSQALLRTAEHRVRELLGQMDRQDVLDCRDAFAPVPTQHNDAAWQRLNRKFGCRWRADMPALALIAANADMLLARASATVSVVPAGKHSGPQAG